MTTPTPPTDALPKLAAEAMGDRCCLTIYGAQTPVSILALEGFWNPHKSHDHAQILIDYAVKHGFLREFDFQLNVLRPMQDSWELGYTATPEEKTRAFLKAHQQHFKERP